MVSERTSKNVKYKWCKTRYKKDVYILPLQVAFSGELILRGRKRGDGGHKKLKKPLMKTDSDVA